MVLLIPSNPPTLILSPQKKGPARRKARNPILNHAQYEASIYDGEKPGKDSVNDSEPHPDDVGAELDALRREEAREDEDEEFELKLFDTLLSKPEFQESFVRVSLRSLYAINRAETSALNNDNTIISISQLDTEHDKRANLIYIRCKNGVLMETRNGSGPKSLRKMTDD
ncbi:hypothetical protein COCCADRAFT_231 [Bipolaris zeicola 26-R-13]|uniref:Uncharacterized protein n=1 Tax=Cochliobolus carbonum (strain 26-R-13) TaxID=930089 RepID=W6YII5_COCC2|nr:uncharacterized protein COCCADRAFT_231 [Bipolaris zeicola 26-R-13]EUC39122.1 hypothetical protein COCCADRAFT_231 [Bipolaris zeicola 26-R-13]